MNEPLDAPTEYRMGKITRYAFLSLMAVFTVGGLAFASMPLWSAEFRKPAILWISLITGLGLAAFMAYGWFYFRNYLWSAYPDRLQIAGAFSTRIVRFADYEGFRTYSHQGTTYVKFIPKSGTGKKLRYGLNMRDKDRLLDALRMALIDLDARDARRDLEGILADESLGADPGQRAIRLERARKAVKALSALSMAVSLWAFFFPRPYEAALWGLMLVPFLAIAYGRFFPGLVRFDAPKKGVYPSVGIPIFIPVIMLAFRSFFDWNMLEWSSFWASFAVVSVVFAGTLLMQFPETRRKPSFAALALFLGATFGYGASIGLNGILDRGIPKTYRAAVKGKRVSHGKHTSYYLALSPWGPRTETKDVDVSSRLHDAARVGDSVDVLVQPGALGIPWFFLRVR